MSGTETTTTETNTNHYCFYHPNTLTELRCNRCGKYICIRDAILTPVGYRCRDCVHAQQGIFYNAQPTDYLITAVITLPLAYIAALIVPSISWLAIFAGPLVGGLIAEAIRIATKKRRGQYTWVVALGCMILATLITLLPVFDRLLGGGLRANGASSIGLEVIFDGVYLILCGGTLIARLRFGEKI